MTSHIETVRVVTEEEQRALSALLDNPHFRSYLRSLFNRTGIHATLPPSDNPRRDAYAEGYRAVGLLILNQCGIVSHPKLMQILESPQ